ncbi:MAG: hypothetical protein AAB738_00310 [Patescibacteria group bacterium]
MKAMRGHFWALGALFLAGAVVFGGDVLTARAAFGVSPPVFRAVHMVKGARYSQIIYLVRDIADQDLKIRGKLEINKSIKDWFLINGGKEIVIPKGVRQFPVEIVFTVPKDAGLAIYSGTLTFEGVPDITGQVSIALGVEVTVDIQIGEGIFRKFSIPLVKLLDIEEGWSPRVSVRFNNEGNVPETVDGATYELFDQFGAVRLAYIQKNKDFPEIPPFTTKEEIVEFPIDLHLGMGSYWGSVTISKGGSVIGTTKTVFSVLQAGSLSGPLFKIWNNIKANKEYYGAGVLLVLIFLIFYIRRRVRNRR